MSTRRGEEARARALHAWDDWDETEVAAEFWPWIAEEVQVRRVEYAFAVTGLLPGDGSRARVTGRPDRAMVIDRVRLHRPEGVLVHSLSIGGHVFAKWLGGAELVKDTREESGLLKFLAMRCPKDAEVVLEMSTSSGERRVGCAIFGRVVEG